MAKVAHLAKVPECRKGRPMGNGCPAPSNAGYWLAKTAKLFVVAARFFRGFVPVR